MSIIFHVPHSSTLIPDEYRGDFFLSDKDLETEIRLMTDWHTADLFGSAISKLGQAVEFPVSRLLVDPERFSEDAHESMTSVGMGVIYTKTAHGQPLRVDGTAEGNRRESLLQRYYFPHHQSLFEATQGELKRSQKVLIIDCHSFPSIPLAYEPVQDKNRPDICIGTDDFHTPQWLSDTLYNGFSNLGYRVLVDAPFGGTITPSQFYKAEKSVASAMIEINRSLYMDETLSDQIPQFEKVKSDISGVLSGAYKEFKNAATAANRF
jgi:N-formylglutamate deformylase